MHRQTGSTSSTISMENRNNFPNTEIPPLSVLYTVACLHFAQDEQSLDAHWEVSRTYTTSHLSLLFASSREDPLTGLTFSSSFQRMTSSDEEDRAQKRMRLEQLQVVREVALDFAAASSFHSRQYIQPEQIEFIENCVPVRDQMAGAQLTRNAPQQRALPNLEEREISSQDSEAETEKIFERWHFLLDGLKKSLDRWTRIYKPEPTESKGTGATAKFLENKSSMSSFTILPSMTPAQLRKCVQQLGPKAISQLGYINAVLQELLVSMKSTQRRLLKAVGQCNAHLDGQRQTGDKEAPLPPPPAVRQSESNNFPEKPAREEQNQRKTIDENRPVTNASNGTKETERRLPTPRQKAKTRPVKWATIAELLEQQKESDAQTPSAECNTEKLTPRKRRRQDHRMEAQLKNLVSILHAWRSQK